MCLKIKFLLQVQFLLTILQISSAGKFLFVIEHEEVFTSCPNQRKNVKNMSGLFDFSGLTIKMEMDSSVTVGGNCSSVWNIEKTDRIEVICTLL